MRAAFLAALVAIGMMGAAFPALARPLPAHAMTVAERGGSVSLEQAARMVAKRSGGRVLAARTVHGPDGKYYEIRVLVSKGRVRVYRVDARSGRIH